MAEVRRIVRSALNRLKILWTWDGRISRLEFFLALFGLQMGATLVALAVSVSLGEPVPAEPITNWMFLLVLAPYVAVIPLAASLAVRRAHDLGTSGYLLIPLPPLFFAGITVNVIWPELDDTWVEFMFAAPVLFSLAWLFLAPGEVRENRFGAPPSALQRW